MSTTPTQMPPPPPPVGPTPPLTPPPKKGVSPLVWVLVGCGALLALAALVLLVAGFFVAKKVKDVAGDFEKNPAMAAAKVIAAANPDVEVISADDDAGTITLRNRKTGEEITMDLEDVKKGRIRFKTGEGKQVDVQVQDQGSGGLRVDSDEGTMTFGGGDEASLPPFLPTYPGLRLASTISGTFEHGMSGAWQFASNDPPQQILDFYQRELERTGFEVSVNTTRQGGRVSGGMLHASVDDGRQTVNVAVTASGGGSEGTITFEKQSGE